MLVVWLLLGDFPDFILDGTIAPPPPPPPPTIFDSTLVKVLSSNRVYVVVVIISFCPLGWVTVLVPLDIPMISSVSNGSVVLDGDALFFFSFVPFFLEVEVVVVVDLRVVGVVVITSLFLKISVETVLLTMHVVLKNDNNNSWHPLPEDDMWQAQAAVVQTRARFMYVRQVLESVQTNPT
jgi:hypothetical protein